MAGAADPTGQRSDLDGDAAARGALYAVCARAFEEPTERVYDRVASGDLDAFVREVLDRTALDVAPPDLTTDDDRDTLSARYNDLFVIGFSETLDPTDGTVANDGPPVPLYASAYREEVSWNDVNLDLARAYDHFGVSIGEQREHHDHVRLQLEFAGYLCRREAAIEDEATSAARARLDFHDRHLRIAVEGVAGRLREEPGTGFYGELAGFADRLSAADVADLDDRLEGDP